jgi:hypothetical protein
LADAQTLGRCPPCSFLTVRLGVEPIGEPHSMKIWKLLVYGILLALLAPPATFAVCGLLANMGVADIGAAMFEQYASDARPALWGPSLLALAPVLLLALALWLIAKFRKQPDLNRPLGAAGLLAMTLVLIWANASYWTIFLPERTSPGWPHGMELLVGPLFFAPPAVLLAMLLAWLLVRR